MEKSVNDIKKNILPLFDNDEDEKQYAEDILNNIFFNKKESDLIELKDFLKELKSEETFNLLNEFVFNNLPVRDKDRIDWLNSKTMYFVDAAKDEGLVDDNANIIDRITAGMLYQGNEIATEVLKKIIKKTKEIIQSEK